MEDTIVPGSIRNRDVKVGNHIAPSADKLDSMMNEFEYLYNKSLTSSDAIKLIHILSSHHRLMWIHPFLDGNGRTARLVVVGEVPRGKIADIIHTKERTTRSLIKELIEMDYLESDSFTDHSSTDAISNSFYSTTQTAYSKLCGSSQ